MDRIECANIAALTITLLERDPTLPPTVTRGWTCEVNPRGRKLYRLPCEGGGFLTLYSSGAAQLYASFKVMLKTHASSSEIETEFTRLMLQRDGGLVARPEAPIGSYVEVEKDFDMACRFCGKNEPDEPESLQCHRCLGMWHMTSECMETDHPPLEVMDGPWYCVLCSESCTEIERLVIKLISKMKQRVPSSMLGDTDPYCLTKLLEDYDAASPTTSEMLETLGIPYAKLPVGVQNALFGEAQLAAVMMWGFKYSGDFADSRNNAQFAAMLREAALIGRCNTSQSLATTLVETAKELAHIRADMADGARDYEDVLDNMDLLEYDANQEKEGLIKDTFDRNIMLEKRADRAQLMIEQGPAHLLLRERGEFENGPSGSGEDADEDEDEDEDDDMDGESVDDDDDFIDEDAPELFTNECLSSAMDFLMKREVSPTLRAVMRASLEKAHGSSTREAAYISLSDDFTAVDGTVRIHLRLWPVDQVLADAFMGLLLPPLLLDY